jgi:hypothetical protein
MRVGSRSMAGVARDRLDHPPVTLPLDTPAPMMISPMAARHDQGLSSNAQIRRGRGSTATRLDADRGGSFAPGGGRLGSRPQPGAQEWCRCRGPAASGPGVPRAAAAAAAAACTGGSARVGVRRQHWRRAGGHGHRGACPPVPASPLAPLPPCPPSPPPCSRPQSIDVWSSTDDISADHDGALLSGPARLYWPELCEVHLPSTDPRCAPQVHPTPLKFTTDLMTLPPNRLDADHGGSCGPVAVGTRCPPCPAPLHAMPPCASRLYL